MNSNVETMLTHLENALRTEILTPTDKVGEGTFVCLTIERPEGKQYLQGEFEQIPNEWQTALKGLRKGQKFDQVKIVAVFDLWS